MTDPQPPSVEVTLLPAPHRAKVAMTGVDRPREESALLIAAIPALRVKSLRHPKTHPPAIPPVVELLRHRYGGDVIAVELWHVPAQIFGEHHHAAAAGVTAEYTPEALDPSPLGRRGVVEAGWRRYADAGE